MSRSCADYEQFKNEALILKSIRHPGIPIVYDIFVSEEDDCFYLIMEFLSGSSLFTHVSDMGHLSKAMTILYGIQICHLVNILESATLPINLATEKPVNFNVFRVKNYFMYQRTDQILLLGDGAVFKNVLCSA